MPQLNDVRGVDIEVDGEEFPRRLKLEFVGATAEDDPANRKTVITLDGSGGGSGDISGAVNVGSGADIFRDETDGTLNFRGITSTWSGVGFAISGDNVAMSITNAANAASALGVLPLTGGTITGDLDFSGEDATLTLPNHDDAEQSSLTPAVGMVLWNTDNERIEVYDGDSWEPVAAAGSDDITNESDVTGATVSDALETLDAALDDYLPLAGGTMSGAIDMGGEALHNASYLAPAGTLPTLGDFRLPYQGTLYARGNGGSDHRLLFFGTGAVNENVFHVGNTALRMVFDAQSASVDAYYFRTNGVFRLAIGNNQAEFSVPLTWSRTVSGPTIQQTSQTSGAANALTVAGQNNLGGDGGGLNLDSGSGSTGTHGNITQRLGGSVVVDRKTNATATSLSTGGTGKLCQWNGDTSTGSVRWAYAIARTNSVKEVSSDAGNVTLAQDIFRYATRVTMNSGGGATTIWTWDKSAELNQDTYIICLSADVVLLNQSEGYAGGWCSKDCVVAYRSGEITVLQQSEQTDRLMGTPEGGGVTVTWDLDGDDIRLRVNHTLEDSMEVSARIEGFLMQP